MLPNWGSVCLIDHSKNCHQSYLGSSSTSYFDVVSYFEIFCSSTPYSSPADSDSDATVPPKFVSLFSDSF